MSARLDTAEASRESLYTILNLPVSASQDDIRHRYKELAVIFHPDRQSQKDANTLQIAEKRFREILRAYEILMDPEQRRIYDTLGEAGLAARTAVGHRYSSPEELRAELERLVSEARGRSRHGGFVDSNGELVCAFDVADAFGRGHKPGLRGVPTRLKSLRTTLLGIQHAVELNVNNNTGASLSGRITAVPFPHGPRDYGNLVGTVRHQFSPRIHFEATANLLRSRAVNLRASFRDEENQVSLRAHLSPRTLFFIPHLTVEYQRQLFPKSLLQGTLVFHTGPQPHFAATLLSPLCPEGAVAWSAGLQLARFPALSAEVGTGVLSGGFKAKLGAELGFTGITGVVTGQWEGLEDGNLSVGVGAGAGTLFMRINLQFLGQRIHIPVVLSHEIDVIIGLCAILVPSGLAVLAHTFVIKPRLRVRRISQLKAARQAFHESIRQRREEAEETMCILAESAHRRAEHERAIDGLVILSATYNAKEEVGDIPISIDITIPLQAQVHNSQLTIPGGRSKAGLLGFYDPSPGARKELKIDYLFHGSLHVVEVDDFSQVILPLRAHLVE